MEEIRRLEEEVKKFHQSKRSLEAELKAGCSKLKESTSLLVSQEELDGCSFTGRRTEELLLQERSAAPQLQASEQTVASLRSELKSQQEALRSKDRSVCSLAAELDLLKTDRRRLIQDLKEQAMAVDHLQLQLDGASKELNQRRSKEASLQEALKREQSQTSRLQSGLQEQQEELCRLAEEKSSSVRLVDQLSAQILEMEEEISSLREHLRGLSARLNDTADLVLELRRQLNSRTAEETARGAQSNELERVREQVRLLQRALQNSQNQLGSAQENFDRERGRMAQQLMGMERLVLELEKEMDPDGSDRTQLEEVRSDNQALRERLSVLQHQVQNLEEDVSKKRRRLEELEQEHQRSREEEELLHKENSRCREEVLDLSSRNLKLSSDNGELSARLCQKQESLQKLQEAMRRTSEQKEEQVQRLQEEVKKKEREELQQQEAWREERRLLEEQLSSCREKLKRHQLVEAELSSLTVKVQLLQEDKEQLQRAADGRQEQLLAVKEEAELLRSQLHAVTQEKVGHSQEVVEVRRKLLEVQNQVEEQRGQTRRLQEQEEELHRLTVQNQQLQQQVSELQVQELQVHKLSQDQQNLKSRLGQAEAARTLALDQAAQADAALILMQAQLQRLKQQEGGGLRERAELLQGQLDEEVRRSRQLEENLKLQVQQRRSQISMKQEQYEKAMSALQQRVDDLEVKLKGVRLVLQEKVQELREQLIKSSKACALLKDVHAENAQLMTALQVTERRQKLAERRSVLLEEKVGALHQLLRDIVPAALAT